MIKELEQLCWAVGLIKEDDAKQVVAAVNRRLGTLLRAHIVKLYWKGQAEHGVILRPVEYINHTQRPDPAPFALDSHQRGVLPWVFRGSRPLWLEEVTRSGDGPFINKVDGEEIPREELNLTNAPQSDSMMVVPIIERGTIQGLYSVELESSGRLTEGVVTLMERLSRALGTLLYNADLYEYDAEKSARSVSRFLNSIQGYSFDRMLLEQHVRTAFVARPFSPEFGAVQERVEKVLVSKGIRAKAWLGDPTQLIISEIMEQVRNSHFCIADLTENNWNVLTEVGMMMMLEKRPLVLRRRGDTSKVPYDISHYRYWEYEAPSDGSDELLVWSAHDNRAIPFGNVLDQFLTELPLDSGFWAARRYEPAAEAEGEEEEQR